MHISSYGRNINLSVLEISYEIMRYLDLVKVACVFYTWLHLFLLYNKLIQIKVDIIFSHNFLKFSIFLCFLFFGQDRSADSFWLARSSPGAKSLWLPIFMRQSPSSSCWIVLDQLLLGETSPEDH